jgi:hypothetical protein
MSERSERDTRNGHNTQERAGVLSAHDTDGAVRA